MNFTNITTEFCFFGLRNGWLMSWKLKVIDIKWDFWHTFITMCWTVRRYNIFSLTRSILQWSAKDHFMHGWVCSILYTPSIRNRVLWICAELTIVSSLKHKNTQPLYIFNRVRVLHLASLKEGTWLHSFVNAPPEIQIPKLI